ncbi:hypothetical protein ACH0BU_13600 [Sphingomonas olei]
MVGEMERVVEVEVPAVAVHERAYAMVDMAPTTFTRDAMSGAAMVLERQDNPIRLNLFAIAIRIYLDHLMDALAPRDQVEASRWFQPEEDAEGPTRRQRLAYGLHGGLTPAEVLELTNYDTEELLQEVTAAYRKLNKHVHGREKTIVHEVAEQDSVVRATLDALTALHETTRECRREIVDEIADALDSQAIEQFVTRTVEELDIMATHHTVDWVGVDERRIVKIDARLIEYEVIGWVGVTLLYGSGGDRRRGEGAEMNEEFPYEVRFQVPVEHPHDLSGAEITSAIDTSAWYGDDEDEDDEPGNDKLVGDVDPDFDPGF